MPRLASILCRIPDRYRPESRSAPNGCPVTPSVISGIARGLGEQLAQPAVPGVPVVHGMPPQGIDEARDVERTRQDADRDGGGELPGQPLLDQRYAVARRDQ